MEEMKKSDEYYQNDEGITKITIIEPIEYQYGLTYIFNVGNAQKYGLNEAIILQNLIYWTKLNKANDNNFYDGYYWTYNSARAFRKLFPFWNERQIRYILESLIKQGIIKTGKYNKMKYDHTLWYAIIDKTILQNCQISETNFVDLSNKNVTPIPDVNTDVNIYVNTDKNLIEKKKDSDKDKDIQEIYDIYPTRDKNNNNRSLSKSNKDKIKIKKILKDKNKEDIKSIIISYLQESYRTKTFLKNFSVLLNNLPELYVPETPKKDNEQPFDYRSEEKKKSDYYDYLEHKKNEEEMMKQREQMKNEPKTKMAFVNGKIQLINIEEVN